MPDNQTTIILNAEDKTAPAFKSAQRSAEDLSRILKSVGASDRQAFAPTPEEWKKRQERFLQGINYTKQAAKEQKEHNRFLHEGIGELASMGAQYLSVGYAIEKARQGFVGFAQDQEMMRVAQARIGATNEQMEKLKQTIDNIGGSFGQTNEEVLKALEGFRESAYLTKNQLGEVLKIGPGIVEMARRFGVSSEAMGQSLGSFMHSLKIPAAEAEQALGMIAGAANDMNLNFDELNRYAPQLAEQMRMMGDTGTEGLSKVLAVLGMTREQFGSTTQAARALNQYLMEAQRGGGVMGALGMDAEQWSNTLDKVVQRGGSVFDFYIEKIKEARKMGYEWSQLFDDTKQRQFWRNIIENQNELRSTQQKLTEESKNFHSGNIKDLQNLSLELDKMRRQFEETWKAVGGVLAASGATEAMKKFADALDDVKTALQYISDLQKLGFAKGTKKLFEDMNNTTLNDLTGTGPKAAYGPDSPAAGFYAPKQPVAPWSLNHNGPPSLLPGLWNTLTGRGNLEGRATGGPVRAGSSYTVGERGTEIFTPGSSGNITPLTGRALGDLGNNTERSLSVLSEIRDILRKQEQEGVGGASGSRGRAVAMGGGGEDTFDSGQGSGGSPSVMGSSGGIEGNAYARNVGGKGTTPQSMGTYSGGGDYTGSGGGSGWLAQQRSGFAQELQNPDTRRLLGAVISAENPGAGPAVAESLMNRTMLVNQARAKRGQAPLTLRDMMLGHPSIGGGKSFYNPIRNGAINSHLAKMNNPAFASRMNKQIDQALGGSNVIKGHTDQGSAGDPNYIKGGTGVNINGERFNDWGYPGSRAFRESFQNQYNAAQQAGEGLNQPSLTQRPEMPSGPPAELRGGMSQSEYNKRVNAAIASGRSYPDSLSPSEYEDKRFQEGHILDEMARAGRTGKDEESYNFDAKKQRMPYGGTPINYEDIKGMRDELSQPITIRAQLDRGQDSQFRRASMRREVNREVREAAWNSYNDIGAA